MHVAAYVGRVGGLAVAVWIGVATGGLGTAWATPADSADSSASVESSASTRADTAGPAARSRSGRTARSGSVVTNDRHPRASSIQEQFERAQADSKNLAERPDNSTLLKLYALFKQGSSGDVKGNRPGMGDFVGRAKYDAWNALRGTPDDNAKQQYIDLIEQLKG